jgi:transcriptional regulator with XRE-family HTH domain
MTKKREPRDFAALLQAWRKAQGFSQADAAAELKMSKRTLQEWEQRRTSPTLDHATPVLRRMAADGFSL